MRKTCPAAIAMLKNHEKCVLRAYLDQHKRGGVWTIGWGHTGEDVHEGDFWGQEEADETLVEDLSVAERSVEAYVRVTLNDHQFGALVDFVYNEGSGTFFDSSILLFLNQGNYEGACAALALYNKMHVGGMRVVSVELTRRRADEQSLFRTPILI